MNDTHDSTLAEKPLIIPVGNNMLMNRVNREAKKVAGGFDILTRRHVETIDRLYSEVAALLLMGKQVAESNNDELRLSVAILMSNQLKSFTAAFALIRTGWRLQPFMCLRNSYEALGVAIHLGRHPEDLSRYKNGQLASTTTINSAKGLLPFFGRIWGDFSEQFTHIGEPFRHIQQGNVYRKDETDLWHCLFHLAFFIWFTYQVAEFIFYDLVASPLFWSRVGDREYRLRLSEKAEKQQQELVNQYRTFFPAE